MKKYVYFLIFSLFLSLNISAQVSDLAIGDWRIFQPYTFGNDVTQSANYVYWSSGFSVLRLNKQDGTTEKWDKGNYLTQTNISRIAFDPTNNTLLVIYDDGAIDLINTSGVRTLTDIKNNKSIIGDRTIYAVYFSNGITYLATGFGLVSLDVARGEFVSTTFTKERLTAVTVVQTNFYIAAKSGVYTIAQNSNKNIADFNNWRRLNKADGFSDVYATSVLTNFNNLLYFNFNDSLCYYGADKKIRGVINTNALKVNYLTAEGKNLIAGMVCAPFDGTCTQGFLINSANGLQRLAGDCFGFSLRGIEDATGKVWFADGYRDKGYKQLETATASNCSAVQYDSPFLTSAQSIALTDSSAWIVSQGLQDLAFRNNSEGFSYYKPSNTAKQWTNYNGFYTTALQDANHRAASSDNFDVTINDSTKKVYVSSFRQGLIELQNGAITKFYDNTNSPIRASAADPSSQRVLGLYTDSDGNVWVMNNQADNPILVLKPNGAWVTMKSVSPQNSLTRIVQDSSGNKWIINATNGGGGIWIYSTNNTLDNINDDKTIYIDNTQLPAEVQSGILNTLCVDLDGRVWLGTANGVCVFDCAGDPFSGKCKGALIISKLGGISEYLLLKKSVNVIAVDGANRKWFGTTTGLIVTSSDGKTQLFNFNTDNSPLLSNNITALSIRAKTGEVFIGTDKGVMVYRADATRGTAFNIADSAYAFPNPVTADYSGDIAIKNLAQDASLKITDVNGNLVYETHANGGEAIWNARDFNNRRVQAGVYLAWVANVKNTDASDGVVVKILILK